MVYRAVLFDLDGTLLNTIKDIADSANNVLTSSGFPQHKMEDYKYFVGNGMVTLTLRALPDTHRDKKTVDKIATRIEEEYSKRWPNNTIPYPGVPELLDALTAASIKIAILSNKPQGPAEQMVSFLLPKWHFEVIMGAKPSIPLKPDPTAALQIVKQMNFNSSEFLYLGDSATDMKTAVASNMYPVGALWGFRTADELLAAGAKALIQQPAQLIQLLSA